MAKKTKGTKGSKGSVKMPKGAYGGSKKGC